MPEMPQKPDFSRRAATSQHPVRRARGRYLASFVVVFFAVIVFGTLLITHPYLVGIGMVAVAPFVLATVQYFLWGRRLSQTVQAELAEQEAADLAAGRLQPDIPSTDLEPWLRGEERE